MRTFFPHSRTALLLLLVACSDRHATRPDPAAVQQPAVSDGQRSDATIPQAAPTPPSEMLIAGRALACFGEGCTPADLASISVGGGAFAYSGSTGDDFHTRTVNGVAGANGTVNGQFGLIHFSTVTGFAPVSIRSRCS